MILHINFNRQFKYMKFTYNIIHINQNVHDYLTRRKGKILVINNCYLTSCDLQILKSLEREMSAARPHLIDPFASLGSHVLWPLLIG